MTSPSVPLPPRAAGHRRSTSLTGPQPPPLQLPRMSATLSSKPSQRSHASSGRALTTTTTTTSSSRFSQGPAATGGQVGLFADLPSVWSEPTSSAAASGGGGNIVLSDTAWPFGPPSQHRYVNPFKIGQMVVCPPAKKQKSAAQKLIDEVRKEKERERRRWERERRRKKRRKKEKRARGKVKAEEEKSSKRVKQQGKKDGEEQPQQQPDQQPRQTKRPASMSSMATTIGTSSSPSSRSKLGASILSLARSKDSASSSKAWSIRSGTSRHMTSEEAQQRVAAAANNTADQGDTAEYCDSTDPFPFRLSTSSGSDAPQHRRSHSPRMSTALAQAGSLVPALRRRDPVRRQGGFFAPLQQQLEQHEPDHPHYSDMTGGGLGASPSSQPLTPMTALHQSLLGSSGPQSRTTPQKTMPRVGFLTRKGSIIRSSSDSAKSTASISTTLSHVPGPHAATGGISSSLLKPRQESLLSGSGGVPDRSRSSLGTISSSPGSTTRYSPTSPSKLSRSFSGEEVRSEVHEQLQHSPTPGQSSVVVFDDEQRGSGASRPRPPITASSSWPTSLAALMNDSPSAASNESSSAPGSGPEGTPSPLSLPLPLPSTAHSSASSSTSSRSASSASSASSAPSRRSLSPEDQDHDNDSSSSSSTTTSSDEESQLDADETEWTGKVVDIYRCGLGTPFWIVVEGLQTQTVKVPAAQTASAAGAGDKAATESSSGAATPRNRFKAAKAKAIGKGGATPASPATATTTTTTTTKVVRREFDARFIRSAEEEKEELDEDSLEGHEKQVNKKVYHQDDPIIVGPHAAAAAAAASGSNDDSGITLPPTLTSAAVQTDHNVAKKQIRQHQRGRHSPPLVILQPSTFAKKSLSAPPLDEAGRGEGGGVASVAPPGGGGGGGGGGGSGQAGSFPSTQQQTPPPLPTTLPPARFTPFIRQRTSSLGCALDVARGGGAGEQTQVLGRQPEVKAREKEKEKEKDAHEDDSIVTSSAGASDERA